MMSIDDIAVALRGKKSGTGYQCQCPAHGDEKASLSLSNGDKGIVFHCHAGCSQTDVLDALKQRGLWNDAKKTERSITATYDYTDQHGKLVFQVVRYIPKDFRQRRPDGSGWRWKMDGVTRVPYRLPAVLTAIAAGEPVYIVEGEKDADNLHKTGITATCSAGGAGKWKRELSAYLKGATVIILPDNDKPGRDHARQVSDSLAGIAANVRIIELPGVPLKGDVSDWLAAGGTRDKLDSLVTHAARKPGDSAEGVVVSGAHRAAVYSLTEDNLARAFADQYREALRFSHDCGRWFVWDGARWHEDNTDIAFHWTRELCRTLNTDGKRQWSKAATAAAVERFARADRAFAMRGDEWDAGPWLLGTPAGTVNLKTGELRAANPADLITRSTSVAPEDGEPRLWRQFLGQATQGDEDLELFLRQIFGYALTGDTREECLFYLYGAGGNGKGTFVGAMFDILGDYAASATMDTFLASKFDRHSTDLAMLRGARLVIASETQKGRAWDEQRVKALTGGDVVTARFMRMDNFMYRPGFKLVLFGNHKPVLRTVDEAWRRRFHVVPFTFRPPKQDATLKERLRAEYPQILRWAIDGCLDWQQNGLVAPARVKAETAEYFASQDQFQTWLDEYCETDRRLVESNEVLFASWKSFCDAIGEQPGRSRDLSDELAGHGFTRAKNIATPTGKRARGFHGLRAKP